MAYGSDYAEGTDILRFLKLDNDGNLRIYSSPKDSGSTATERWAVVSDQCQVFGNSPKFWGLFAQCAFLEYASSALIQFSYNELQRATKGF
ncbi:G-type lectin S-receptor-like serine/threonine-protein kinase [Camellia lanceoleosa]|uniref:G-type lectin S-receptor-like serine/threonine-protein kinase n=1 Tax=Camellia lanceoleosa TaxID=1840588 RepID=A0ACC0HQP1_9ERIC|nr:G-type lectin S-receptor-like serine/threonine-protein kinase [Camellia lanceoleosa]